MCPDSNVVKCMPSIKFKISLATNKMAQEFITTQHELSLKFLSLEIISIEFMDDDLFVHINKSN